MTSSYDNHIDILRVKSRAILKEAVSIRRELHMNPELSFKEHKTAAFVKDYLSGFNIPYRSEIAGTGIIATIEGSLGTGPVVALRAELDALPITEQGDKEYSSRNNGVMHACGHDAHMAMLLASAKILNELTHLFRGKIVLVFQPGEELVPGGASLVLAEGYLRSLKPSVIIAQHVLPEMLSGNIGFKAGKYMASSDELYIQVRGKGGHAALPGVSTDQIRIASELVCELKDGHDSFNSEFPIVLGIGKFIANGATNVVPDTVFIEGTLRTFDESSRKEFHQLIKDICTRIAKKYSVTISPEIRVGYPVLTTDTEYTLKSMDLCRKILGKSHVEELPLRMSSEDFAFYSLEFPVVFYRLGVKKPYSDQLNLHTSNFDIDESAMETGILIMCSQALEMVNSL